jgi:hypothetical protein
MQERRVREDEGRGEENLTGVVGVVCGGGRRFLIVIVILILIWRRIPPGTRACAPPQIKIVITIKIKKLNVNPGRISGALDKLPALIHASLVKAKSNAVAVALPATLSQRVSFAGERR